MNRKLIVSILAIILAITMILSVVLAALPRNYYSAAVITDIFGKICAALPASPVIAV
ncbi:MAG: hypothetical protein Q4A83_07870 [Bacillota bacterium]|nr:hypothetical protein [Bacillota bacterium]